MAICYRIFITLTALLCPPLAVFFLTGFGLDTLINCILFVAAVIPSHIHALYLSSTYFARRRRVRDGLHPGRVPKPLVYSENVLFGGARWDEVQALKRRQPGYAAAAAAASGARRRRRSRPWPGKARPRSEGVPGHDEGMLPHRVAVRRVRSAAY